MRKTGLRLSPEARVRRGSARALPVAGKVWCEYALFPPAAAALHGPEGSHLPSSWLAYWPFRPWPSQNRRTAAAWRCPPQAAASCEPPPSSCCRSLCCSRPWRTTRLVVHSRRGNSVRMFFHKRAVMQTSLVIRLLFCTGRSRDVPVLISRRGNRLFSAALVRGRYWASGCVVPPETDGTHKARRSDTRPALLANLDCAVRALLGSGGRRDGISPNSRRERIPEKVRPRNFFCGR